ncbi:Similar to predicted protein [Ajellomyces capsulatus NAm1]; acc. no. XP_001540415 [Pyronema omphalodes CBS 100304]|uniref:Aminoglycoside phosphotransferase domain-containing protein n=1 Tax=Pyronema omphalodes (strain CBS 100304) TaxID=1076935 RepID=U4LJE1_PYROM|nr:Similar to predicted protein [Ajellomyces capsulatus NAm1]; acc. no. XP_001540415 [Pyronema omphalodes CBS 100304]
MYSTSIRRHNMTDDNAWLSKCTRQTLPVPPLERYIHILPDNVVKKRLAPHERGEKGYVPDFATLKDRDDNEIAAIKLVEDNLPNFTVRVPKLVYQGADFNVWTRIPGVCVDRVEQWAKISPRQMQGLVYQARDLILQLSRIPNPYPDYIVRSPHDTGRLFRPKQFSDVGPFTSVQSLLAGNPHLEGEIHPYSRPVFSHMDWDMSNIILAPNLDYIIGVVDFERAAWFPEGGKALHNAVFQWDGWKELFDGSEEWLEGRQ